MISQPIPASPDPAIKGLEVYIVGGAVRDQLLGLPAGDRDWVVVGSTPEAMSARGFLPVGGDFPVFLHPVTKEEYALARTERKSGRGYKGFTFHTGADVTLEDDLRRRDLTINAIAQAPDGRLIDPWNGQADIQSRTLRHVGDAFAEDPVRLLRLARFAARFGDFCIAPETLALCRLLVTQGEVDTLVPERVWQEISKGLLTTHPALMFDVLQAAGALERILPGLVFDADITAQLQCAAQNNEPPGFPSRTKPTQEPAKELPRAHHIATKDAPAAQPLNLPQRFALLCRKSPDPAQLGRHLRAPIACIDHARLLPAFTQALLAMAHHNIADTPSTWLDLIEHTDGLRKPQRFLDLLQAAQCVLQIDIYTWKLRLDAVNSIDAGVIARAAGNNPKDIKAALRVARLAALAHC